jgi:hypothetical protein
MYNYCKKDIIIIELQKSLENLKLLPSEYSKLEVRYDELKIRYDELSKQHEKTSDKLDLKISQCDTFIQNLAREGSNKPTTTNNTINNTIRNHLSPTFTIDKLEEKKLEEKVEEVKKEDIKTDEIKTEEKTASVIEGVKKSFCGKGSCKVSCKNKGIAAIAIILILVAAGVYGYKQYRQKIVLRLLKLSWC